MLQLQRNIQRGKAERRHATSFKGKAKLVSSNSVYGPDKVTSIQLVLLCSLAIVKNGKPFTDGEFAKSLMLDVANELFDDFTDKEKIMKRIKDMPLSARPYTIAPL
ncbi:General transcription factor II-I repeat domain-containing protein 2-like [Caligus rogercresseyi]|uniref:General transcription factor II-I repeat domain-containing protein 2-like n=1 Tax=Caligus rogercresseyi TaxID=217165 RepID=A0A7T8KCG1_CALRO|nr:General transcription factor II-I repeat domain-containing protein 2-like [Caligus rogercresseyi]